MGQTLLETLSRKQIILFAFVLFVALVAFFVVGGTKGADPASANIHIANMFMPKQKSFEDDNHWIWYVIAKNGSIAKKNIDNGYYNGKLIDLVLDEKKKKKHDISNLLLATKIPHPGSGRMFPHYQFMLVLMGVQMEFVKTNIGHGRPVHVGVDIAAKIECTMEFSAKVGYSDVDNPTKESDWKLLMRSDQKRPLTCHFTRLEHGETNVEGYYTCDEQHFFELGSVAHKHYLINMKLPYSSESNKYCLAGNTSFFDGIHLTEIHQNGGYTISLFVSKTVMFPFVIAALIFFLKRVKRESREKTLLEKSIIFMATSLSILLLPVDWLTLAFDMPFMLFFSDLRQGLFYTALLVFWCIFAGEHLLDQANRNKLSSYKIEIGCVIFGCLALFIFDFIERGMQLSNPFHTIWKHDVGETAAKAFLGLAAAAAIIYAIFFTRLLFFVYRNMRMKESALPAMQEERRRYYENLIFRYRALLWITLFTVFATVVCFVLDQINETSWKFEDGSLNEYVVVSSAMHFGVFGLWSIYVFGVVILYSPTGNNQDGMLNVQYRRSAHLMRSQNEADEEDEDEINFRHPKT